MKKSFIIIALLAMVIGSNAQIGYQVSLLNTATGEPRANENVEVTIEITDSEGTSICKETKNAITNDFGVLSLQVGNATTFENANWSKLPFYVSATVDDILVGKSQILNVPVAEAAKTLVGNISKSDIIGEWVVDKTYDYEDNYYLSIKEDGSFYFQVVYEGDMWGYDNGYYKINGDFIYFFSMNKCGVFFANYDNKSIIAQFITFIEIYGGFETISHPLIFKK